MLTTLRLKNFRGFKEHSIPLQPCTLVVGRNNAGKSSLVEALRLLSLVTTRFRALGYHKAPHWGAIPRREFGVRPSLNGFEINYSTIFFRYADPPAEIDATFDDNTRVRIYIGGEDQIHAVIFDPQGHPIRTKSAALALELATVAILPQIGPLDGNEVILSDDYIRRAATSNLASKHFRNQLQVFSESFCLFREMVEATWSGLQVLDLAPLRRFPGEPLRLTIRDGGFAAEVSAMGHGLQMWLQTMWFLARARNAECIILDEPDVYMHPDLQRRLVRYLKARHQQVIIATHSVEMMSEVEPEEILVVDRSKDTSRFASGSAAVQRLVEHVGSVHNVQLARLWNARQCLLVEGKDVRILSVVHRMLFPDSDVLEAPSFPLGGWGGWSYAIGSALLLKNSGGDEVAVYCLLDSDARTPTAIAKRYEEAKRYSVRLHIWSKKEIENYFLIPSAIVRCIERRMPARVMAPSIAEVLEKLDYICEQQKDEIFDATSAEILAEKRALGSGGANRAGRQVIDEAWQTRDGRLSIAFGKKVFGTISEWAKDQFGVAIGPARVAHDLKPTEIDLEMVDVITSIEKCEPFNF